LREGEGALHAINHLLLLEHLDKSARSESWSVGELLGRIPVDGGWREQVKRGLERRNGENGRPRREESQTTNSPLTGAPDAENLGLDLKW
jgi:hypothetical protein